MTTQPPKLILSLGAGVQSTTVLLMSCRGDLPKLDAAVFADTCWEPRAVYVHLEWLAHEAERYGIPVYITSAGNIREDILAGQITNKRVASLPYYTAGASRGRAPRQCTRDYKIRPIRRETRRVLGYGPRDKLPIGHVEMWLGISTDEATRQTMSTVQYITHYYPLIDEDMSREDCYAWMSKHDYPEPPRSACIGCPYRSNDSWRILRDTEPESFEDACQFDEAIRQSGKMRESLFLHEQRVPLRDADLGSYGKEQLPNELCPSCFT